MTNYFYKESTSTTCQQPVNNLSTTCQQLIQILQYGVPLIKYIKMEMNSTPTWKPPIPNARHPDGKLGKLYPLEIPIRWYHIPTHVFGKRKVIPWHYNCPQKDDGLVMIDLSSNSGIQFAAESHVHVITDESLSESADLQASCPIYKQASWIKDSTCQRIQKKNKR